MVWVLGALGLTAAVKAKKSGVFGAERGADHGILTPGRKDLYERAMRFKGTPEQFHAAAEEFDRYGLPIQAKLLRARGDARKADNATWKKRREVIRAALNTKDPYKAEEIAHIAETQLGMTDVAMRVREYARGLREAASLPIHHARPYGMHGEPAQDRYNPPDPQVAEPGTVDVKGDGQVHASATQMAGEPLSACGGPGGGCRFGAHGECLVHTTGGDCAMGAKDVTPPPPVEAVAQPEDAFSVKSGF